MRFCRGTVIFSQRHEEDGDNMPMIIEEGRPPMPVIYHDWAEWRNHRREASPPFSTVERVVTAPCTLCQGAGRYFEPAGNGEGLVPRLCVECGGTGRVHHL